MSCEVDLKVMDEGKVVVYLVEAFARTTHYETV